MKTQFKITGRYYTKNEYKFREVLNIKKIDSKIKAPDLMVIMMNPGGFKPLNGIDNSNTETLAKPDVTQNQIMKIMLNGNFKYARVLNLSDLREPKSKDFYDRIEEMDALNIAHSIFNESRKEGFNKLWVPDVPVIFGWGVNRKLKNLGLKAIEKTKVSNPIGVQKPNTHWAYYHPLPPNTNKQKEMAKQYFSTT
tara:strand:- start:25312 stop:25896 length:585 start_codon:yes stop_codon:yes gene_type:complete